MSSGGVTCVSASCSEAHERGDILVLLRHWRWQTTIGAAEACSRPVHPAASPSSTRRGRCRVARGRHAWVTVVMEEWSKAAWCQDVFCSAKVLPRAIGRVRFGASSRAPPRLASQFVASLFARPAWLWCRRGVLWPSLPSLLRSRAALSSRPHPPHLHWRAPHLVRCLAALL